MRRFAATLAAIGLIGATGCGDGRLDSGELHDKVKAACAQAHKALLKLPSPTDQATSTAFVTGADRATELLLKQLRLLKPPADAQQQYELAVGLVAKQQRALAKSAKQMVGSGDPVIVIRQLADTNVALHEREQTAWQVLGVPECSSR